MKKIVLLVVLHLLIVQIFAQKLTGKVSNENNEPLPGATVKVENTFYAESTNAEGQFAFEKLKPGN